MFADREELARQAVRFVVAHCQRLADLGLDASSDPRSDDLYGLIAERMSAHDLGAVALSRLRDEPGDTSSARVLEIVLLELLSNDAEFAGRIGVKVDEAELAQPQSSTSQSQDSTASGNLVLVGNMRNSQLALGNVIHSRNVRISMGVGLPVVVAALLALTQLSGEDSDDRVDDDIGVENLLQAEDVGDHLQESEYGAFGPTPFLGTRGEWDTFLDEQSSDGFARAWLPFKFGDGPLADCYQIPPPAPAVYGATALHYEPYNAIDNEHEFIHEEVFIFDSAEDAELAGRYLTSPRDYQVPDASDLEILTDVDTSEERTSSTSTACPFDTGEHTTCGLGQTCQITYDSESPDNQRWVTVVQDEIVIVVLVSWVGSDAQTYDPLSIVADAYAKLDIDLSSSEPSTATSVTNDHVNESGTRAVWGPRPENHDPPSQIQDLLNTLPSVAATYDAYVEQQGDSLVVNYVGSDPNPNPDELSNRLAAEGFELQSTQRIELVVYGERSGRDGIVAEFSGELAQEDAQQLCEHALNAGVAACVAGTVSPDNDASAVVELFPIPPETDVLVRCRGFGDSS